jgi:hypothetical protein
MRSVTSVLLIAAYGPGTPTLDSRRGATIHSGELAGFSLGAYHIVQLSLWTLIAPLQEKAFV